MNTDIFTDLQWRGLVHQTTDEKFLPEWLRTGSRCLYAGFDPTADSLHVGSLLPLMALRRFQKAGHRPIALVGGATGMIGDPSGKSAERNLLSVDMLRTNVAGLEKQIRQFLDFDTGAARTTLVNNFDWMQPFSYLEFLRDVGKHFPVNVMLGKDSVKSRIERDDAGISYTEFSYMLLQAYDFVHLQQKFGCELQIGGSDQWGNITAGTDLGRRMHSVQLYGMTFPLLLTSEGKKMGKTEKGTIWLFTERTSPYAFYQYWINVADADVGMCLRFLTELSREEIEGLDASRASEPHLKKSQLRLAESVTEIVHGKEGLGKAKEATAAVFNTELSDLDDAKLLEVIGDMPSKSLPRERLNDSTLSLIDAMVEAGLATSKSEARRAIEQGGAYINDHRCNDLKRVLSSTDLLSKSVIVLRKGQKKYALLRFT